MFIHHHANPSGKTTGDCVIRAISLLENISWRQALLELTAYSYFFYELADDNDPRQQAQQMLNSGQMSQQQFEWCRQMANSILGMNY